MLIAEFLREDDPDDWYEARGFPPVPPELSRRGIIRYRGLLQRYIEKTQKQLDENKTSAAVFLRLRKRAAGGYRRNPHLKKGHRRGMYYTPPEPFVSDTKIKKMREHNSKQRGRPYHMRSTRREDEQVGDIRACRDAAILMIAEIERRFHNLPPEDRVEPKKRPLVAPEIGEFF